MMLTGQPGARDLGQNLADHPAQRVLGEDVISDQIFCHLLRPAPGQDQPYSHAIRAVL